MRFQSLVLSSSKAAGGLLCLLLAVSCAPGDGKDGSDKNSTDPNDPNNPNNTATGKLSLSISASGLGGALEGAALRGNRLVGLEDETYAYPGIGMNYGDVVVDSLKIKLQKISLQVVNEGGGTGSQIDVADFGKDGKELDIAEGYTGKVEATSDIEILPGTYQQVGVLIDNAFSLKAYAYLDRDNDGDIDATVWTTAAEVKMENQKLAPGSMPGYDHYRYPWVVATMVQSTTDNSNYPLLNSTFLPTPIVISKDGVVTKDAAGVETTSQKLTVDLLIDTFRAIKVWDGRFGTGFAWTPGDGNASALPFPVFPYPQGLNDSRVLQNNIKTSDLYPPNKPAFAFSNYLSIFGIVNGTGIKAQNYLISKSQTITPYNTQAFTLVLDGSGNPMFAKLSLGESNETLHIGPIARGFAKQADGSYNFGSAYGDQDENGKWDGGLRQSEDLSRAGHLFKGFRKLTTGQRAQMTMENGPRCKSEYDYCVDAAGVAAYFLRVQ